MHWAVKWPFETYICSIFKVPYIRPCLDVREIREINQIFLRDHPYITSAHFWTFSDPPTHPMSAWILLNVSKKFLTPPTQSLCWRNIGMVPYKFLWTYLDIKFFLNFPCIKWPFEIYICLLHFVAFFHVASLFSTGVDNKKVG